MLHAYASCYGALHLPHRKTSLTAACNLRAVAGMHLQSALGASGHCLHSAAGVGPSAAGAVMPSVVLVNVDGKYLELPLKWDVVRNLRPSRLLQVLLVDPVFAGYFKGVDTLGACTIVVVKNAALPTGSNMPTAEHEGGNSVGLL